MLSDCTNPHTNSRTRGRSLAAKDHLRISPPPPTASPIIVTASPLSRMDSCYPCCGSVLARTWPLRRGRRRVLLPLLALALLFLFLFSPSHDLLGLPPALQGFRRVSPASITSLMRHRLTEIHGLLYYTVHESESLSHDAHDPTRSLDLSVYADGDTSPKPDWPTRVKDLNTETPLIVFSKTYCPYSRKAKEILAQYDLVPQPKIIEVDLRDDGDFIKAVLTRLTGRSTFPNVILRGKSIGGSDDISAMHGDGRLRQLFEDEGLIARAAPKDEEE